jgi:septal ring-binding cell division protein DamX
LMSFHYFMKIFTAPPIVHTSPPSILAP